MFEGLIVHYGYWAIGLGTFFEGEAVLIAAGAIAHKGLLSLPIVVCSATVGSLSWAQVWFQVGRTLGGPVIERRPTWRARAGDVERFATKYGSAFVVCFRFIAGMGTLAPALLGASRYPARRFIMFDIIGAVAWATAFACAGFGLGAGLDRVLGRAIEWDELLGVAIGFGLLLWLVTRLTRGVAARRTKTPRAR